MDRRMSEALDRHITGNYGEDQFSTPQPSRNTDETRAISHELAEAWTDIERVLRSHAHGTWLAMRDEVKRMEAAIDDIVRAYTPGYNAESLPKWPEEYDEDGDPTADALREVEYPEPTEAERDPEYIDPEDIAAERANRVARLNAMHTGTYKAGE